MCVCLCVRAFVCALLRVAMHSLSAVRTGFACAVAQLEAIVHAPRACARGYDNYSYFLTQQPHARHRVTANHHDHHASVHLGKGCSGEHSRSCRVQLDVTMPHITVCHLMQAKRVQHTRACTERTRTRAHSQLNFPAENACMQEGYSIHGPFIQTSTATHKETTCTGTCT